MAYSNTYSDLYDPAFPQSQLDSRVELLLGGVWTDVSSKVYSRAGIQITRGHPDESSTVQPSVAGMQVNNRGGQFSPRNPNGAYFGLLGRNTPARVSLPNGSSYLRFEADTSSYAWCPDGAALDITGDIDVRVDVDQSGYVQNRNLAAKANVAANQVSWAFRANADGTLSFTWSANGSTQLTVTSTATRPQRRTGLRATLAVSTGTVTFYTASTISGTWTQLGSAASGTSGAATSIYASSAPVQVGFCASIGASISGQVFGFQLRNGIGGSLVASPDFTAQVAGAAAFSDAQGNIWSLAVNAEISDRSYRHHGEVPAWPQRWDNTGRDVYVPIEPSGLLRRLTQSTPPALSPLYRAYATLGGATALVAYWPCEDGSQAPSLASGLPGGSPMQFTGSPQLASGSGFVCSQPIPVLNGGKLRGQVPTAGTWSAAVVRFLLEIPSSGETNNAVIASVYMSGTIARMDMVYTSAFSGQLGFNCYDVTGTLIASASGISVISPANQLVGVNGWPMRVDMDVQPSGGNVVAQIQVYVVGAPVATLTTATVTSASLGPVTQVLINPRQTLQGSAVGHVSVQQAWTTLFDLSQPLGAYLGEAAATRFARLCSEQGITSRIYGFPADSEPMGYQPVGDFVSLLQQCEDADRGLIYEPAQALALGYRTRASLYNQTAALALDYSQAHLSNPLEPTDDDQFTINDVTVTLPDGTSARQYLASGTMSIQPPPNGIGEYTGSVSANLATDGAAAQVAGWILNVGTVDEPRYPSITVDLSRSELAAYTYLAQGVDIGDRITVDNTPSWLPPEGISQVARGSTETMNNFEHTLTWNCAPETPYRVGIYDDPVLGHYDTDGSTLAGNYTSTATALSFATTNATSPAWTTAGGDFPFDVSAGGEQITVVSPGTNLTTDPLFASGVTNWSGQNSAIAVNAVAAYQFPDGSTTIQVTPNGSSASGGLGSLRTAVGSITVGHTYTVSCWAYAVTAWTDVRMVVDWYDSTNTFLSTSLGSASTIAAGAWTPLTQTLTAPASASRATARFRWGSTPASTVVFYVYCPTMVDTATVSATSPQPVTVVRSRNGIVKAQAAGTDVRLYQPSLYSL